MFLQFAYNGRLRTVACPVEVSPWTPQGYEDRVSSLGPPLCREAEHISFRQPYRYESTNQSELHFSALLAKGTPEVKHTCSWKFGE